MPRRKTPSFLLKLSKIIFWMAVAVFILTVSSVFWSRLPARQVNHPLRIIFSPTPSLTPTSLISPISHVISYVHDGDTIYTRDSKTAIRLIGIDAPELAGSYRCGKDAKCDAVTEECGATAAKEKLKELVLNREVWLVKDTNTSSTDKYNRFLRYVYFCRGRLASQRSGPSGRPANGQTGRFVPTENDCLDINLELIRLGLSRESGFGNAYEKQKIYKEVETEAKTKKLGIWGMCL